MKNSIDDLMANFEDYLYDEENIILDFEEHAFLNNDYGNTPCFEYNEAKTIVIALYEWAHEYIDDNQKHYPDFDGFTYNLQMECDELRICPLEDSIRDVCGTLYNFYEQD